ncbi:site-specific tyrosine recombinase XerC [Verrucomicrobiota bacterium]
MPRIRGYRTTKVLRHRDPEKRGGQAPHNDGLSRSESTMSHYLEKYLEWLKIRNSTEDALQARQSGLRVFLVWAEERSLFYPEEITRSILESYQRYLWHYRKSNGQPLGITTQSGRLSLIKKFFSWLCRERVLEANPASELVLPKSGKRLPDHALSIKEVEAVISIPDINDPLGIRDRAILEIFYSSALRRRELVRLKVGDLDRDRSTLHIRLGKGYKDRIVPVGRRAMIWLNKYLQDIRPLLLIDPQEQSLFLSSYGNAFNPDYLSRMIKRFIERAEVSTKGGCHLLRHTCATHMFEGGADIRAIQQLLGHSNLETTAVYTRVSIAHLQNVHAETHPAERK